MGAMLGAQTLDFDPDGFHARDDGERSFDPILFRGFKLIVLNAFGATELTHPAQTWTGNPDASNFGETARLTLGIAFTSDRSFVYASPKAWQTRATIRPYRVARESRRAFARVRKSCTFLDFGL